jgi:outer membrane protein assembly factor BamA
MSLLRRSFLITVLAIAPLSASRAQESLPDQGQPITDSQPSSQSNQSDRIVDGRPALYSVKRTANPLTWIEAAIRPVFRSAEDGRLHQLMLRKPDNDKISGVKIGAGSAGTSSGYGPRVTFFHKDFLGRGIQVEVPLTYTYSQYQVYEFNAKVPLKSGTSLEQLSFDLGAGYSSRARDDFFGLGNDSNRDDERQLRLVSREARAGFSRKLNDLWKSQFRGVYRNVGVTKPAVGWSAQDHFDSTSVPGLFGATLGSLVFSVGRDTQQVENMSFKGGSDQFELSFNRSLDGGPFAYWQYHADSQHFFPISSDGRKVIAARGLIETNVTTDGHTMPFFDMPALGSSRTIRGFENFRFRDKTALAMSVEYRYRIWPAMDWGLFLDEGQVAPRLGDLGLDRFHTGYGVRLFVWPKPDLPISLDFGRSNETWRLYVNINARF